MNVLCTITSCLVTKVGGGSSYLTERQTWSYHGHIKLGYIIRPKFTSYHLYLPFFINYVWDPNLVSIKRSHPSALFWWKWTIKGLYPHNFERALKSKACVQIESIHIDGFENVKKKLKMVPHCPGNQPKSPKRGKKCLHAGQNMLS